MSIIRIAKLAGVSSATVSRVINGSGVVSESTAQRVKEVIERFAFVPDSNAVTLRLGKSEILGLILPDMTNPFFADLLDSLEAITSAHEQDLLIANTRFKAQTVEACIRRMLMRRVDGIALIASEAETGPLESLARYRVPLVTLDRRQAGPSVSDVSIDYESAFMETIGYLKHLGHRRIAFIGGAKGLITSAVRTQAFVNALSSNGLKVYDNCLETGDYRATGGALAMSRLLALRRRPTAIMTSNDFTALGALHLLNERSISVPEQMSIVGFDDILICKMVQPPLTTMRVCRDQLAQMLYQALQAGRSNVEEPGRLYQISATLEKRGSVSRVGG